MNGRIYDPTLGRFLQADPHIQAPMNSQNYNRYSYVLNNPMSYTDPSGYFFKKLAGKLLGKTGARLAGFFAGGVLGAVIGNWAFDRAMNSQGIGAVVGVALNFVPGCQVWCSALFSAQRTYYATGSLSAAFHAGGRTAAIAGVMSYIGPANTGNPVGNVAVDAVVGGTFSELTGGKFKNGAATAAFFSAISQDWGGSMRQPGQNNRKSTYSKSDVDAQMFAADKRLDSICNKGICNTELEVAQGFQKEVVQMSESLNLEFAADILAVGDKFTISDIYTDYMTGGVGNNHYFASNAVGVIHTHAARTHLNWEFSPEDFDYYTGGNSSGRVINGWLASPHNSLLRFDAQGYTSSLRQFGFSSKSAYCVNTTTGKGCY